LTASQQVLKARFTITPLDTGQRTIAIVAMTGTSRVSGLTLRRGSFLAAPQPPFRSRPSVFELR
jgi:hypothetical protein